MKNPISLYAVVLLLFFVNDAVAQGTWSQINAIFQTRCDGSSCHSQGSSNPLKLVGPDSTIYDNVFNVDPFNLFARNTSNNKLVYPGQPDSSYLLRKLDCGRGSEPILNIQEGFCMPSPGTPGVLLTTADVDLLRQWILAGAPEFGSVAVNEITNIVNDVDVFPNPFSKSINISYQLLKSTQVKAELLNILGARQVILIDLMQEPGQYSWKFESELSELPESLYILNLYLDDQFISRKIMQIK